MTSHRAWNSTLPACRKAPHANRSEAEQEIGRLKEKPETGRGEVLRAYYCPACRAWHVGHRAKPWRSGERRPGNPERPAKAAKPRKRLRSKGVKRTTLMRHYAERFPECELCSLLGGSPAYRRFAEGKDLLRSAIHVHHCWTPPRWEEASFNFITACGRCHAYAHGVGQPAVRLAALWGKVLNGTFDREAVAAHWTMRDPIEAVLRDYTGGVYGGDVWLMETADLVLKRFPSL